MICMVAGAGGVVMSIRLDLSLSVHIYFSKMMCIYMCLSRLSLCVEKGAGGCECPPVCGCCGECSCV